MRHLYIFSDPEGDDSDVGSEEEESDEYSEDASSSESEEEESDSESEDKTNSESGENESDPQKNEESTVAGLQDTILKTLQKLKAPTAFACSGVASSLPIPGLHLPDHGVLRLPLSTSDAQNIISVASQSPFGKGEKTLIDQTIRKSWELNPNQFSFKNSNWNDGIETILNDVCFGLGIKQGTGRVSAELYKLLVYEPGAFFKPHKDSEKAPGMFGTLVVCLPSTHEGGKLILTHQQETYEFETATSSHFNYSYAAWFADITHEVHPVTSGYRLVLVYNLIRETDFKIPSYDLTRGHAQELLELLKIYNSMLEKGDSKHPPLLLYRLKHKYTHANLQLKLLKPQDFAHVQTLSQISAKLGFSIYLATLELVLNTCDEGMLRDTEWYSLENMVELDGKLFLKSFDFDGDLPNGALINPKQMNKEKADQEEHEGPTGNEGSPATYWYHETVVVLLPPSKQLELAFKFSFTGDVVKPLFRTLMQEFAKDPAQKPKYEKFCELALKQKSGDRSNCQPSEAPFFKEALASALKLGRWDLLGVACKSRGDEILFEKVDMLSRLAAKDGLSSVRDKLIKCVQGLSSVANMFEFSKLFSESFETAVEESDSVGRLNVKKWLKEVVFTAISKHAALTKADAIFLGRKCKTIDWNLFKSKTMPAMLNAKTMVKIDFVDKFMSTFEQNLDNEQQSFVKVIIHDIWNKFVFNDYHSHENELLHILKTSVAVLPSECVETTIIPAILKAIPKASHSCVKKVFLPLVRLALKNELVGFKLATNNTVPPSSHKRVLQALLTKFLKESIMPKPQPPTDWSFPPAVSCNCGDCSILNKFLQDPVKQKLKIWYKKRPCKHLNWRGLSGIQLQCTSYYIETIRRRGNKVFLLTKHRRKYEDANKKWKSETEYAIQDLSKLENDEPVKGRLKAYLQPYYSVIMNAVVEKLPDVRSWATTHSNENKAPNQAKQKREGSKIDRPPKRFC